MKLVPMYLQNMRLSTVLEDLQTQFSGKEVTPANIQRELDKRFAIRCSLYTPDGDVRVHSVWGSLHAEPGCIPAKACTEILYYRC